jgi:hypothetical protein
MDQRTPKQNLESQGWVRQFTIDADRADEYIELFEELGEEVRIEPLTPDLMLTEECTTCILNECDKYLIIYIRTRE